MGEVSSYPNGTFCWIDLGTTDVAGAKAFYGALLSWDTEDLPGPDGDGDAYTMCRLRGMDVAGMHRHSEDEGVGWSSTISVDDADAATSRARDLGATVLMEPNDLPGVGRMSLLRDPGGAVVTLSQPRGHIGARLVNDVGAWNWNELVTPLLDEAAAFYGELFGWTANNAPGPIRRIGFGLGELLVGGAHAPTEAEGQASRWTVSFMVADAAQTVERAQQLGGAVLLPVMDVPTGRFAIVSDPAGASFTVTESRTGPVRGVDGS
jgi:uncharacterized protein